MKARETRRPAAWGIAVVRGRSMQPTLYDGDRLLVRHGATPRVGDVVVVLLPARPGVPGGSGASGEPRGSGRVVAVKRATRREGDGWWVERDSSEEGVDSWSVGVIPDEDVIAVVRFRVWPLRRRRLRRR